MEFDRISAVFKEQETLSLEEVRKLQTQKMKKLLIHCQENVPFYADMFKKISFNAYSFSDLSQIEEFPVLSKSDVNKDYNKFIAKGTDESKCLAIYTGGTTGASLKNLKSYEEECAKWAIWWRYRNRLGITRNMIEARFASNQVVPLTQVKAPYWRFNRSEKVLFFSQYHLNSNTVEAYVGELKKQGIEWILGSYFWLERTY